MRRRWIAGLCVAVACALTLAPATAHAACEASPGSTYNVTVSTDTEVGEPSVPGSLRYVVERASPGSVIGFCQNFVIKLLRPVTIPESKKGLQFLGPTTMIEVPPANGKFIVRAESVVFRGLNLENVQIDADHDASGLKVLGSRLSVIAPSRNGKGDVIALTGRPDQELRDVQIGSEAEPNTIVSDQTDAISSFYTLRLQIVGNTIDATAGTFAISDTEGRNLLLRGNTILGSFAGETFSGRILDNTITAARLDYGIKAFHDIDRFGPLLVKGNKLGGGGGIRLERDGVDVVANTVSASRAPGVLALCSGSRLAPVRIEANTLTGNALGLVYGCRGAPPAVVKANRVEGNRGAGMDFLPGVRARVTGGTVRDNGGAGARVGPRAAVLLSGVAFSGNAGPGIDLLPRGVTPNGARKQANRNLDWPTPAFDAAGGGRVRGTTCRRCVVEVFTRESGPRAGNPLNGEGAAFLGTVKADGRGRFVYPAGGGLTCAQAATLTFTATERRRGRARDPVTSEFSRDIACTDGSTQIDTTVGPPVITGGGPTPG